MQTTIHSNDFTLTDALENFIKQQVSQSMAKCSDKIESLKIRLKDVNDPKQVKECSVEVRLAHQAPIVVSKRSDNAYTSIREAVSRASRTTLRRVKKRRVKKAGLQL